MEHQTVSRARQRRVFIILVGFLIFILGWFVWIPSLREIKTGTAQLEELRWFLDRREDVLATSVGETETNRKLVAQQWAAFRSAMYTAFSPTVAGTEMLRRLHDLAPRAGVELRSSQLVPADLSRHPGQLSADLRGEGDGGSVYEFLYRLSDGVPMHRIERLNLYRRPGERKLHFEIILTALWSPDKEEQINPGAMNKPLGTSESVNLEALGVMTYFEFDPEKAGGLALFGEGPLLRDETIVVTPPHTMVDSETYQSEWRVIGIVEGERGASAILRHRDGSETVSKVGDVLGDERVIAIRSTNVLLERGGARSAVSMYVEPIGILEREIAP